MDTRYCSGAFIIKDNEFLLGRRAADKKWYAGVWDVFGGHAEPGESPLDALIRELKEELGVVPSNPEVFVVATIDEGPSHETKYYIYVVTEWTGGEPVNCSDEHSEIKWFTREALNDIQLANPDYLLLIDDYLRWGSVNNDPDFKTFI